MWHKDDRHKSSTYRLEHTLVLLKVKATFVRIISKFDDLLVCEKRLIIMMIIARETNPF
jgi:hypothetical protein